MAAWTRKKCAEVLGISPDSTEDEMKDAYSKKIRDDPNNKMDYNKAKADWKKPPEMIKAIIYDGGEEYQYKNCGKVEVKFNGSGGSQRDNEADSLLTFEKGNSVTLSAIPNKGYRFNCWVILVENTKEPEKRYGNTIVVDRFMLIMPLFLTEPSPEPSPEPFAESTPLQSFEAIVRRKNRNKTAGISLLLIGLITSIVFTDWGTEGSILTIFLPAIVSFIIAILSSSAIGYVLYAIGLAYWSFFSVIVTIITLLEPESLELLFSGIEDIIPAVTAPAAWLITCLMTIIPLIGVWLKKEKIFIKHSKND